MDYDIIGMCMVVSIVNWKIWISDMNIGILVLDYTMICTPPPSFFFGSCYISYLTPSNSLEICSDPGTFDRCVVELLTWVSACIRWDSAAHVLRILPCRSGEQ